MAISGRAAIVAVTAAALAAGCAGSGYTYHANKAEKLYFKVPDDWTVFDTGDFIEGEPPEGTWIRGFSAADEPTVESVFSVASEEPRGYVQIVALGERDRDLVSIETLRATNFGADANGQPIDPIIFADENPDQLQILGYDNEIALATGSHGVRLRVAVTPLGSAMTGIIDQTVLVNKRTTKRYLLSIGCSAECFETHEKEIEEVIESWTLEAT